MTSPVSHLILLTLIQTNHLRDLPTPPRVFRLSGQQLTNDTGTLPQWVPARPSTSLS